MTTSPRTVSIMGLFATMVLGLALIVGVFDVPVPLFPPEQAPVAAAATVDAPPPVTGTVAGVVTDATARVPLRGVQLSVEGTGIGGLTNAEGRYLLMRVPVGEQRITAEYPSHGRITITVNVSDGETMTADVQLREQAAAIAGVVVAGGGAQPAMEEDAPPVLIIDGERVPNRGEAAVAYLDRLNEREAIESIEVVKPPESVERYGSDAGAGAILVTLKDPNWRRTVPASAPADQPIFTPYTVDPRIVNRDEIRRALLREYPAGLRDAGIGGTVEVYFFINERGEVEDVRIDKSSGHAALDDAALAVARVYEFSPALNRDQAVPMWVAFPIVFSPGG